ncbi:MAG: DUF882 domain-containing protein, partial [Gammaproteobacteria bacterium]|nr:DUF882 domain-containing protein [Gammaproteobacteria bacterium]
MNDWCKHISLVPDHLTRRHFLKLGAFAGLASLAPFKAFAGVHPATPSERALGLYNTHTGEQLKTVYCANGEYIPGALAEINHILRDHRNEQTGNMDPQLLDLLHSISARLDSRQPFHVISGFRSKATLPRIKILHMLEQSKARHLSAEDVYKALLDSGEDVG